MPLYWAWMRVAWPEISAEERNTSLKQWGESDAIKPIVQQLNELKAKALASGGNDPQFAAMRALYAQQQNMAAISNMMAIQHRTRMSVINNIGSSNTRYEYKYVYRYR